MGHLFPKLGILVGHFFSKIGILADAVFNLSEAHPYPLLDQDPPPSSTPTVKPTSLAVDSKRINVTSSKSCKIFSNTPFSILVLP